MTAPLAQHTSDGAARHAAAGRAVDDDRERQLAVAGWFLGWIGGPLPALVILLATRNRTWSRSYNRAAAIFWTVTSIVLSVSLANVTDARAAAATVFIASVVAALAVTIAVAVAAARRSRHELSAALDTAPPPR
jgi:hypothetical protein